MFHSVQDLKKKKKGVKIRHKKGDRKSINQRTYEYIMKLKEKIGTKVKYKYIFIFKFSNILLLT